MQCSTPSSFGSRTLKALSEGKLPPKVAIWPGDVLHPALALDAKCAPLSAFERKLILDMPELSIAQEVSRAFQKVPKGAQKGKSGPPEPPGTHLK